jgi:hypothetical protein
MNFKFPTVGLLRCACLALLPAASAQVADLPELTQLRANSEQQLQSASAPAQATYLNTLETLKQQLTRTNKLDEAVSVDNEIKRIKREPTAATKAPADPPELLARRADYYRTISRLQVPPLTTYLRALEPLKQQFRRDGKLDAVVAVDNEIKAVTEKLKAAQSGTNISTAPPAQIAIESVTYGDPKTKRTKDATEMVRTVFDSGAATITLSGRELRTGDPAPGTRKVAVITYTVNGKRKEKTFPENTILDFKKELR